jgi:hypothetical protein
LRPRVALSPLFLLRVRNGLQLAFLADHRQAAHGDAVAVAREDLEDTAVSSETNDGHVRTDKEGHDLMVGPPATGINWLRTPPRTTKLYDRTSDEIALDEVERIVI